MLNDVDITFLPDNFDDGCYFFYDNSYQNIESTYAEPYKFSSLERVINIPISDNSLLVFYLVHKQAKAVEFDFFGHKFDIELFNQFQSIVGEVESVGDFCHRISFRDVDFKMVLSLRISVKRHLCDDVVQEYYNLSFCDHLTVLRDLFLNADSDPGLVVIGLEEVLELYPDNIEFKDMLAEWKDRVNQKIYEDVYISILEDFKTLSFQKNEIASSLGYRRCDDIRARLSGLIESCSSRVMKTKCNLLDCGVVDLRRELTGIEIDRILLHEKQAYEKVFSYLSSIPSISSDINKGGIDGHSWWVEFTFDTEHQNVWSDIQYLGYIFNSETFDDLSIFKFGPVPIDMCRNDTESDKKFSWRISGCSSGFTVDDCVDILGRFL